MQQKLCRNPFQQAVHTDQLHGAFVAVDGQAPEHPGDQPHRALSDRIAAEHLVELRFIAPGKTRLLACTQPRRDKRPRIRSRRFAAEPKGHFFS